MPKAPAAKPFEKYGYYWPAGTDPLYIEFHCIKEGEETLRSRGDCLFNHYREAQALLWPEDDAHRWSDLGLKGICENEVVVLVGCADSNKTYLMSRFVLVDWWANPDDTLWLVSSTELRGAELRIWGVIKQLFNRARTRFPWLPGRVLESMHCISTEDISTDQSEARLLTKGIIFIPCKRGGTFIGLGAYQGIKPLRTGRLGHAGDECSAMPRAFLDAYSNWYGKTNFKGIMAGNPFDLDDSICVAAEPVDGWQAWTDTEKTQTWRSKFYDAFVIAFDGRDSPNFDGPPDKPPQYPYLIGRKKLEAVGKTHGKDSWQWFNQCVGKPRPGAAARRVVTRPLCEQWHAFEQVVWLGDPTIKIGACDAAYGGMGGDRCVIGYIEFGKDVTGHMMLIAHPPVVAPVKVNKIGSPEDQIAKFTREYMEGVGVLPQNFFFDGRGSLGVSYARYWSPLVEAVEFNAAATERPVSNDAYVWDGEIRQRRLQKCHELYSKFVTELWFSVHYTIISDQMRQLPTEIADELCRREWRYASGNRIEVETKEEMKSRTGQSPDLADCFLGDTLVTTDNGDKPIETLKIGDNVLTPLGYSPIVKIHIREVSTLFTVLFSDGSTLCGKGNHKVFTWDKGWMEMCALKIDNKLEMNATLWKWTLLKWLFTEVGNTGFKRMVDTVVQDSKTMCRRSFFQESSGTTFMGLFRKAIASIIKMGIAKITESAIYSWSRFLNMLDTTDFLNLKTLAFWKRRFVPLSLEAIDGGRQGRPNNLCGGTVNDVGNSFARSQNTAVAFVEKSFEHGILTLKCVPHIAAKNANSNDGRKKRSVWFAAISFALTGLMRKRALIGVVESKVSEPAKVYNLTLAEHNVYYANGVLVQNCFVTALEGARRRGFQIARVPGSEEQTADDSWHFDLRRRAKDLKNSFTLSYK